jgi:ABC-2 type transport system ATP-binding protein
MLSFISRRDFWKILSNLIKEGMTIIMSTPYLDEAERCTRVAMMNKGKIIALDNPSDIKESIGKDVFEIVCVPVREAFQVIKENSAFDVQLFGDRINIVVDKVFREYKSIEKMLIGNSVKIVSTRIISPSLENVFIYKIKEAG